MGREVGIERNSPLMLGGFLLWAIFCPLSSPRPYTRFLRLQPSSWKRCRAFQASSRRQGSQLSELFVAVMASTRQQRWRPGCALGSSGLGRAPASLGSGLRCASSLTLTLLWPPWLRLLMLLCCSCCWRGQRRVPRAPARADLPLTHTSLPRSSTPGVPSEPQLQSNPRWHPTLLLGKATARNQKGRGTRPTEGWWREEKLNPRGSLYHQTLWKDDLVQTLNFFIVRTQDSSLGAVGEKKQKVHAHLCSGNWERGSFMASCRNWSTGCILSHSDWGFGKFLFSWRSCPPLEC